MLSRPQMRRPPHCHGKMTSCPPQLSLLRGVRPEVAQKAEPYLLHTLLSDPLPSLKSWPLVNRSDSTVARSNSPATLPGAAVTHLYSFVSLPCPSSGAGHTLRTYCLGTEDGCGASREGLSSVPTPRVLASLQQPWQEALSSSQGSSFPYSPGDHHQSSQ